MSQHRRKETAVPQADDELSGERLERNRRAAALLREWMAEDEGYDREIWPLLEEELRDLRMQVRESSP